MSEVKKEKLFYSEKELSERFPKTPGALAQDRYQRRGLPYCRVGNRIYYDIRDVIRYLEENKVYPSN